MASMVISTSSSRPKRERLTDRLQNLFVKRQNKNLVTAEEATQVIKTIAEETQETLKKALRGEDVDHISGDVASQLQEVSSELKKLYNALVGDLQGARKQACLMTIINETEDKSVIDAVQFLLGKEVDAFYDVSKEFVVKLWNLITTTFYSVYQDHCDVYPSLYIPSVAQDYIGKRKNESIQWMESTLTAEKYAFFSGSKDFSQIEANVISVRKEFKEGMKGTKEFTCKGLSPDEKVRSLALSLNEEQVLRALELASTVNTYWHILVMRLWDVMVSHMQGDITKFVVVDSQHDLYTDLQKSIVGEARGPLADPIAASVSWIDKEIEDTQAELTSNPMEAEASSSSGMKD